MLRPNACLILCWQSGTILSSSRTARFCPTMYPAVSDRAGCRQVPAGSPLFRVQGAALRVCVTGAAAGSLRAAAATNLLTNIPGSLLALSLSDVQVQDMFSIIWHLRGLGRNVRLSKQAVFWRQRRHCRA